MNPTSVDLAINLLQKSQRILLLTHAKADCDGLGSMLAIAHVLKGMGKEVTAAANDPVSEHMQFLPFISLLQQSLTSSKDFVITLDCARTPLSKIKYNLEDQRVHIIITPKEGTFSQKDVSFTEGGSKYDLIVVFDAGDLEHLGGIYERNTQLFFETPILNIDHHASNTEFGQVNVVDIVAASTTEVMYGLLLKLEEQTKSKLIDADVATLLLAGLITDTGSFQHANTSPRAMEIAAKLLDHGARQQEIIKNIYKTKKLSTLKLWGIALSKVQVDAENRMVWSSLSKEDLLEAGAHSEETGDIIDNLLSNAPGAEVILLIKYNDEGYVSVSMRSTTNAVDVAKLCGQMKGGGHVRAAGYKVYEKRPFDEIVSEAIALVRQSQEARLKPPMPEEIVPKMIAPRVMPASAPAVLKPVEPQAAPQKEEIILNFSAPASAPALKPTSVIAPVVAPVAAAPVSQPAAPAPAVAAPAAPAVAASAPAVPAPTPEPAKPVVAQPPALSTAPVAVTPPSAVSAPVPAPDSAAPAKKKRKRKRKKKTPAFTEAPASAKATAGEPNPAPAAASATPAVSQPAAPVVPAPVPAAPAAASAPVPVPAPEVPPAS